MKMPAVLLQASIVINQSALQRIDLKNENSLESFVMPFKFYGRDRCTNMVQNAVSDGQ